MIPSDLSHLANHLWQSTLSTGPAAPADFLIIGHVAKPDPN